MKLPHIHLATRRTPWHTCRCGMVRWRVGYPWHRDPEPVRAPEDQQPGG